MNRALNVYAGPN